MPNQTYTRSINEHSDLTYEEKVKYRLGLKTSGLKKRLKGLSLIPLIAMESYTPPKGKFELSLKRFSQ